MANSIRHQIMDAVVTALEGIRIVDGYESDVRYVSENWEGHQQIDMKKLPALFPIDTNETKVVDAIGIGATDDSVSELTVNVTGVVFDRTNTTRLKRTNLLRDVEKALRNDTSLAALIVSIVPDEVTTDQGTIPNYSIWDQSFIITYSYSSTAGG